MSDWVDLNCKLIKYGCFTCCLDMKYSSRNKGSPFTPFKNSEPGLMTSPSSNTGVEWTSTHQCTNVDGSCTDKFIFSIPAPSQVEFFCLPFLSPDLNFSLQLYFLPTPFPVFFPWSLFFFFGTLFSPRPPPGFFFKIFFETFPTHPPTAPPLTYSPIFKLKVDSSASTYSPINLKCVTFIPTHLSPYHRPTYQNFK